MNSRSLKPILPLCITIIFTLLLYILLSSAKGFVHKIDPVMLRLHILGIEIPFRYYGMVYFIGFIAIYSTLAFKRNKEGLLKKNEQLELFMFLGFLGMIAGARFFEIIFYDLHFYLKNPLEIIKIWKGGLSFHGALAGVAVVSWIFTRKKQTRFLQVTDTLTMPVAFFLALGRGANFINGELYGTTTTLPWGVQFPGANGFRHPTQIYEAIKCLYIFSTLFWISSKKPKTGTLTFSFLIGYGFFRFLIEFLKNYDQYGYKTLESPALNIAQLLCLLMTAIGISGLIHLYKRRNTDETNINP